MILESLAGFVETKFFIELTEAIVQEDPFHRHGLAEFRIIEFRASQRADDFPKRVDG